jgi:hypothetical protein
MEAHFPQHYPQMALGAKDNIINDAHNQPGEPVNKLWISRLIFKGDRKKSLISTIRGCRKAWRKSPNEFPSPPDRPTIGKRKKSLSLPLL